MFFVALLTMSSMAFSLGSGLSEDVVMPAVKSTALPLLSPAILAIPCSVIAVPPNQLNQAPLQIIFCLVSSNFSRSEILKHYLLKCTSALASLGLPSSRIDGPFDNR